MNEVQQGDADAAGGAERDLDRLHAQIAKARDHLSELQHEVALAEARLHANQADSIVLANEQLMLAALRARSDAEAAQRDSTMREKAAELRLAAQRRDEENRVMAAANRYKRQFLANMSHELRTPLNAIIGFSQLLASGELAPQSPKRLEYVDRINASGQELLQLVDGVLDLARIVSGAMVFHPEPVALSAVVADVIEMHRVAAGTRAVVVHAEVDEELGDIVIDRTRLGQALSNYLDNAIKFSHPRGLVAVRARAEGEHSFRVEVEDAGIGIAAADQSLLFVEFQQIDASDTRRHLGTGIGLSLTRLLVEAQGGSVGMRSRIGAGSTFHFVLPRRPAVQAPAESD